MAALIGASVFFAASTSFSLWNNWRLKEATRATSHSLRFVAALAELEKVLLDAEPPAQPAVSLPGDAGELERLRSLRQQARSIRISLLTQSPDDSFYRARMDDLRLPFFTYFEHLEKQVLYQRNEDHTIEPAALKIETAAKKQKVRQLIDEMREGEKKSLCGHEEVSYLASRWAVRFNTVCGISSVVILIATVASLFRTNHLRQKLETVLLRSQAELEKHILNRTAALNESEQRIRAIVDAAAEGIVTIDEKGVVNSLNPAASHIFGYAPEEVIGRNARTLVPSLDEDMSRLFPENHSPDGGEHTNGTGCEVFGRRKDGMSFPMELSVAEIRLGGRRHYAGFVRDITLARQAQEQLRRSAQEAAQKNKELETIICAISHDLRSPLVNIQGFSNELARISQRTREAIGASRPERMPVVFDELFGTEIPRALRHIHAGVGRMEALLNGIVRFSHLGRAEFHFNPIRMNALVANVIQALKFQLDQAQATVRIDSLPDCVGDVTLISQVFCNLIDNALKYSDPMRPLQIAISGRKEGGASIYCVSDNGLGIAAEHQEKVFEMFRRLPRNNAPGEGLGLAIVRRIMERHHGRIWVESTPGLGAAFFFSLPGAGAPRWEE